MEDAKEILSNAFLRVFQKLHLFDSSQPFEPWFKRLIIHASSDFYRYAKLPFEEMEKGCKEFVEDTKILDQLQYDDLLKCITLLSPKYRAVFNLYVIDGYKHHEIAELLGITVGTSKSNLSKAKLKLQKIIIEKYKYKVRLN